MFARRLFFVRFPLSSGNPSSFVLFAFIDFLIFAAFHCLLSLFPLLCPSFLPGCTFLGGFIIFEHHFTLFFFFSPCLLFTLFFHYVCIFIFSFLLLTYIMCLSLTPSIPSPPLNYFIMSVIACAIFVEFALTLLIPRLRLSINFQVSP